MRTVTLPIPIKSLLNIYLQIFQDINPNENDQTMRFRKKIEKDEKWVVKDNHDNTKQKEKNVFLISTPPTRYTTAALHLCSVILLKWVWLSLILIFLLIMSLFSGDGGVHKAKQCHWDLWSIFHHFIIFYPIINFNIVMSGHFVLFHCFAVIAVCFMYNCTYKETKQDYFNEVDEATDCEEPRAKTVNLYRLFLF